MTPFCVNTFTNGLTTICLSRFGRKRNNRNNNKQVDDHCLVLCNLLCLKEMEANETQGTGKDVLEKKTGTSPSSSRQEKKNKAQAPPAADNSKQQHDGGPRTTTPAFATVASSPRLYVGNLHPRVTQVHLESLLSARSLAVQRIQFIASATTGASFCFVTLPSVADATRAIQLLHNRKLMGRHLVVQPAHEQQQPSSSSSTTTRGNTGQQHRGVSVKKERRQLDDQIQAIRQKLKEKDG